MARIPVAQQSGLRAERPPVSASRHALRRIVGKRAFLVLLLPGLVMYLWFVVYPFLSSFLYSLYNWNGIGPLTNFIGFQNFTQVLTSPDVSPLFYHALLHNLTFFAIGLAGAVLLSMPIAYLLTTINERVARAFQIIFVFPFVLPGIVVGYLFSIFLAPNIGVVSVLLQRLGWTALDLPWFGSSALALPMIGAIATWQGWGFTMLIFMAAIVGLPSEVLEAARIDGANRLQVFTRIVFPLIRPTFITVAILGFIGSFNQFDLIIAIEGPSAGPNFATDVTGTLFYRTAFGATGALSTQPQMGLATAFAVIGFILVMVASTIFVVLQRRYAVQY